MTISVIVILVSLGVSVICVYSCIEYDKRQTNKTRTYSTHVYSPRVYSSEDFDRYGSITI